MSESVRTGSIQTDRQKADNFFDRIGKQWGLKLICNLCKELNNREIIYCHWKSNAMLDYSARGDNDLDLLVDRSDVQLFTEILYELGFRLALDPPRQRMPGVLHFYGYDVESDRLVHVHAHFQLVLGHDATKNFRLPIERAYLKSAVQGNIFKVPAPEFEFIVFVIRMVLKHSTWDVILSRQRKLSAGERQEMEYLQILSSQSRIYDILKLHLPCVKKSLFDACILSLQPNCPLKIRVRVGQKLQSALKGHARLSQILDVWLKLWRRLITGVQWRVFGYVPRKRMTSGGLMVSIIGGDGAGKTTAIDGLHKWLSKDFETVKLHMGKPPWSRTTIAVRGFLKIGRSLGLYPFMRTPIQYTADSKLLVFPGYPWLFREVCVARDRYLAYVNARRFATNGGLVICDRFPLPQVKLMDGPQVERMTTNFKTNSLINLLIALEKRYYRPIMLPELLIVLRAEPDKAVQRKTEEDAASVRARSEEIWRLDWQHIPAHVIDADQSKEKVLSDLKDLVWSIL